MGKRFLWFEVHQHCFVAAFVIGLDTQVGHEHNVGLNSWKKFFYTRPVFTSASLQRRQHHYGSNVSDDGFTNNNNKEYAVKKESMLISF